MHAERDQLVRHVFPELIQRARERRVHLELVDLRWGVETRSLAEQEKKEERILSVCLAEIERSRPFLVALLGDRYGLMPSAERVKATTQQVGISLSTEALSITELEIEYGVLADPNRCPRCLLYLRDPLPWDELSPDIAAIYSDAHSKDPRRVQGYQKLQALKQRLLHEHPDRVRRYHGTWDTSLQRIVGLEDWGRQVLAELWRELDEETRDRARLVVPSWQSQERWTFEACVAERELDFIGRQALLNSLYELALSSATNGPLGVCLTGAPGSGKSALLARLHRMLEGEDIILLGHAAGVSARSTQLDSLLRRWIEELAEHLTVPDPSSALTTQDELEQAFADLLSQAATRRRVVLLLDALNELAWLPRACRMSWVPALWPQNARLIATSLPGPTATALAARPWVLNKILDSIPEQESYAIVIQLCRRHRKSLHPEIAATLCGRQDSQGQRVAGNPLWLRLAVEELVLLGADSFTPLDHSEEDPEQRLHALLMRIVDGLPAEITSLFGKMIKDAESECGVSWVRSVLTTLAISRRGLRESDLKAIKSPGFDEGWDLQFAVLRRVLRSHLIQRGENGEWSFFHEQLRAAVLEQDWASPTVSRTAHRWLANHLASLPMDDPLRATETMVHLIGTGDLQASARYFGSELTDAALAGATHALAEYLLAAPPHRLDEPLTWICGLPAVAGLDDRTLRILCDQLCFDLANAIASDAPVSARLAILRAAEPGLADLHQRHPEHADHTRHLAAVYSGLSDAHRACGEIEQAISHGEAAMMLAEQAGDRRDLLVDASRLGNMYLELGDAKRALGMFVRSCAVSEELADADSHDLQCLRDRCACYVDLGDYFFTMENMPCAQEHYRKVLVLAEELQRRAPTDPECVRDLCIAHSKLGDLHGTSGALPLAREHYHQALSIAEELLRRDPESVDAARDAALLSSRLGEIHLHLGDSKAALNLYSQSLKRCEELHRRVPDNAQYADDLATSYSNLGDAYVLLDEPQRGLEFFHKDLAISDALQRRAPESVDLTHNLGVTCRQLSKFYLDFSGPGSALEHCNRALVLAEEMLQRVPDNKDASRDLLISLSDLAFLHLRLGDRERATKLYRRALVLAESHYQNAPNSDDAIRDLSITHERLGDLFRGGGEAEGALGHYLRALELREALVSRSPDHLDHVRSLGVTIGRIGDLRHAMGDTAQAKAHYEKMMALTEALYSRVPGNADIADDLALCCSRLATHHLEQGELQEALQLVQRALQLWRTLRRRVPESIEYRRAASIGYERLAQIQQALGATDEAIRLYKRVIRMRRKLWRQAPESAELTRDLIVAYNGMVSLCDEQGDGMTAASLRRSCLKILRFMKEKGMSLDSALSQLLAQLELVLYDRTRASR